MIVGDGEGQGTGKSTHGSWEKTLGEHFSSFDSVVASSPSLSLFWGYELNFLCIEVVRTILEFPKERNKCYPLKQ